MAAPPSFDDLGYERFRELARDARLSPHEKVGFPDAYRDGREPAIFADLLGKLPMLVASRGLRAIEIGPGCAGLPRMLSELCARQGHRLAFVDSPEMLSQLPDGAHVDKRPGAFPHALRDDWGAHVGAYDAVLAYSVAQYVFAEGNLWDFLDRCLALLAEGGRLLIGDLPNQSMRSRLLASAAGERFHRALGAPGPKPAPRFGCPMPGEMDDSVVLALLARARAQGFHAWVLPQAPGLPFDNRREDVLVQRP